MRFNSLRLLLIALLCISILIFFFINHDIINKINEIINVKTPALLFLLLMAFLPSFGFPLSAFLILSGMKFGILGGLLAACLLMPIHMVLSFLITHSFLRNLIQKILHLMNYSLPSMPENKIVPFTVLFMGLPGPPYALKNYILALSGVPFRYYLGLGFPINMLLGIPFIGLGGSAMKMNISVFIVFFLLLVLGFIFIRWLKRKYYAD